MQRLRDSTRASGDRARASDSARAPSCLTFHLSVQHAIPHFCDTLCGSQNGNSELLQASCTLCQEDKTASPKGCNHERHRLSLNRYFVTVFTVRFNQSSLSGQRVFGISLGKLSY